MCDCTLVARAAHNGGKDGAGRVVAGESCLAHPRPVVHHQSLHFTFVGHDYFLVFVVLKFLSREGEGGVK